MQRRDRGEALLSAAVAELADLPAAVDTQLRPPAVILDASKSANGNDVLAVAIARPSDPEGPIDLIRVVTDNSRFRNLNVRSGDLLKYFILQDETVDEERQKAGFTTQLAMEFNVAQVIDDNMLLIEKGIPASIVQRYMEPLQDEETLADATLPRGILVPAKIEIWRNRDDRLIEINQKLGRYAERRLPPLGWQPSPDEHVLTQIITWLNQWLRQSEPKSEWQLEPLLETVDSALASDKVLAPYISEESLAAQAFQPYEGRLLQEAVWHRDISRWAQGANFNDVAKASALFDWTVRNVELVADEEGAAHRPWQVLLYGRGTADQRAWVFAMLCRQQGLNVVMLRAAGGRQWAEDEGPNADDQQTSSPQSLAPSPQPYWLPALLLDDQLYLYDPRLGLPIPGPTVDSVATLEQARADDVLLRQLDLDGAPYPLTAEDLAEIEPFLVADPFDLTRRAYQVESKLTGDDRLALASRPSELVQKLKSVPDIAEARLWGVPFRTLRDQLERDAAARRREAIAFEPFALRPLLWKARARHFQGRRILDQQSQEDATDDHREAAQLYTSKSVRPPAREIAQIESAGRRRVDSTAKLDATYWVGLLSFDDHRYDVAAHWLGRPELTAADSPWSTGARYNLARTFEAQEKLEEAIELLQQDDSSAQQHGNRLRARQLQARLDELKESE